MDGNSPEMYFLRPRHAISNSIHLPLITRRTESKVSRTRWDYLLDRFWAVNEACGTLGRRSTRKVESIWWSMAQFIRELHPAFLMTYFPETLAHQYPDGLGGYDDSPKFVNSLHDSINNWLQCRYKWDEHFNASEFEKKINRYNEEFISDFVYSLERTYYEHWEDYNLRKFTLYHYSTLSLL